jgi:hypothetical protein
LCYEYTLSAASIALGTEVPEIKKGNRLIPALKSGVREKLQVFILVLILFDGRELL